MKKLLCVALVLVAALPLAFSQGKTITVRAIVPVDFGGTATATPETGDSWDFDTKMGFGIGAEAMVGVWKELKVGGGAQFGFGRGSAEDGADDKAKFGFIPIYGLASYGVNLGVVNPYGILRIGYNFLTASDEMKGDSDLNGGMFFALGAGASFKIPGVPVRPFVELNYAIDGGGFDVSGDVTDIAYKRLQLAIGAGFSL